MSEIKTATQVEYPRPGRGDRCLWRTSEGDYIVTSSADNEWASETMAFESDEEGEIMDWEGIGRAGVDEHREAIEAAGYEIEETQ